MLVKVFGSAIHGVSAQTITIEVNVDQGVGYHLVGLPDNAIKESSHRISAALKNVGYKLPGKKITINMAPADLRKEGSAYDLSLAIGILAASGKIIANNLDQYIIMGELSLDGGLQPIKGGLPIAIKAREEGFKGIMLAKRVPSILPPLTMKEALETTKIHSVAGKMGSHTSLMTVRPFRSPHHTISDVALVGGGAYPQPGEISLAHNGVLFLDELPEFKRAVLEVMRQPLEDREVTISRAKFSVNYPSSFMLVASMNPSPSGYFPDDPNNTSSQTEMQRYMNKLSGPLLDRIDIHIEVQKVEFEQLAEKRKGESSLAIRERVLKAREVQAQRYKNLNINYNAQIGPKEIEKYCELDDVSKNLIKNAMERLNLSARAYDRILKVARTIADLESSENINPAYISEAIQYRSLDRDFWKT